MKNIIATLLSILVILLIVLLSGWKTLGWMLVIIISLAIIFIIIGFKIIVPYMNRQDKKEMYKLEKTIKDKEAQGYTEDELTDLKRKLYLMKKIHEQA